MAGHPLTWQLTTQQSQLVEVWLPYAYRAARRASRRWGYDLDEALSDAHIALCLAIRYSQGTDPYPLKWAITKRINARIIEQMRKRRPLASTELVEAIASHIPDTDTELDGRLLWQKAKKFLSPKQFTFLQEHIGEGRTLQSIANDNGVTKERVRQTTEQALDHLRYHMGLLPGISGMGAATPPA
jgi:RNA polymerase sigma factor (sigma-70 family)